jgi:hypothetical protein
VKLELEIEKVNRVLVLKLKISLIIGSFIGKLTAFILTLDLVLDNLLTGFGLTALTGFGFGSVLFCCSLSDFMNQ